MVAHERLQLAGSGARRGAKRHPDRSGELRGNIRGARKLYHSARNYLAPYGPKHLGLDVEQLLGQFDRCLAEVAASTEEYPKIELDAGSAVFQGAGSKKRIVACSFECSFRENELANDILLSEQSHNDHSWHRISF